MPPVGKQNGYTFKVKAALYRAFSYFINVSIPPHRPVMCGVGFAVCEVRPRPVALGVTTPLARLCADFGRHRCEQI